VYACICMYVYIHVFTYTYIRVWRVAIGSLASNLIMYMRVCVCMYA